MFTSIQQKQNFLHCRDCNLDDFKAICEEKTQLEDYPQASEVADDILIYEKGNLDFNDQEKLQQLEYEWASALMHGPGVIIIRSALTPETTDGATEILNQIIQEET